MRALVGWLSLILSVAVNRVGGVVWATVKIHALLPTTVQNYRPLPYMPL